MQTTDISLKITPATSTGHNMKLNKIRGKFDLLQLLIQKRGNELQRIFGLITVEPTMFLYMMAFMLTTVIEEALFVYKACTVNHGFNKTICDDISNKKYTEQHKIVQVTL